MKLKEATVKEIYEFNGVGLTFEFDDHETPEQKVEQIRKMRQLARKLVIERYEQTKSDIKF